MAKKVIDPTDKYVGNRVRTRRLALGLSQTKLADAVGVTFQQVQKYEKGRNRISASRLSQIAHTLQVSVSFFFEGAPNRSPASKGKSMSTAYLTDFISSAGGQAFMKAFMKIDDTRLRRHIVDLVDYIAMRYNEK